MKTLAMEILRGRAARFSDFHGWTWVFTDEEAADVAEACHFPQLADRFRLTLVLFAADALGDLWVLTDDGIRPEEQPADVRGGARVSRSVGWIGRLMADRDEETGLVVLEDWVDENGALSAGRRLIPAVPLGQGGRLAAKIWLRSRFAKCWLAGVVTWLAGVGCERAGLSYIHPRVSDRRGTLTRNE